MATVTGGPGMPSYFGLYVVQSRHFAAIATTATTAKPGNDETTTPPQPPPPHPTALITPFEPHHAWGGKCLMSGEI